jgi:hypothetical protein
MKRAVVKNEQMRSVLESAARFQKLVPDAVMVGGSAVSAHIGHRLSYDHDHVLADLEERFAGIFELLTAQEQWKTAHVRDGKLILGSFDGIETGLRQLRRARPLETERVVLGNGESVRVPTIDEMIRIKAFLITNRNQVRDYLDVAALADRFGTEHAARVLLGIDDYYEKALTSSGSVASELVLLLGEPTPKDTSTVRELARYKGLEERFQDWSAVVTLCQRIASDMLKGAGPC